MLKIHIYKHIIFTGVFLHPVSIKAFGVRFRLRSPSFKFPRIFLTSRKNAANVRDVRHIRLSSVWERTTHNFLLRTYICTCCCPDSNIFDLLLLCAYVSWKRTPRRAVTLLKMSVHTLRRWKRTLPTLCTLCIS